MRPLKALTDAVTIGLIVFIVGMLLYASFHYHEISQAAANLTERDLLELILISIWLRR